VTADDEMRYRRGTATVVASWGQFAAEAVDAHVQRFPGVVTAVFPHEPERAVYNNAVIDRGLDAAGRTRAVEAMQSAYGRAGVTDYAAWVHETDTAMRVDLERLGYAPLTSTLAMALDLDELRVEPTTLELRTIEWDDYLRVFDMPAGLLARGDHTAYRVLVAHVAGEPVASAMSFELDGDCGVYNVGTVEHARRRGLGAAVTGAVLAEARARGCTTASLQSTAIAERVYAGLGFRSLGRIVEYGPPS